jgi:hypothetical protein
MKNEKGMILKNTFVWQKFFSFLLNQFDSVTTIIVGGVAVILVQFDIISPKQTQNAIIILLTLIAIQLVRRREMLPLDALKEIKDEIEKNPKDIFQYTPNGETNYRLAVTNMLQAKKVCATYFLRRSWEEKPLNTQHREEFTQYFNILNNRIVSGNLHYRWVVTIENYEKFTALFNRIKGLIKNMPAINEGYTRLRVIQNNTFSPRINFQVNDNSTVIIGFPTEGDVVDSGALVGDLQLVRDFQSFFELIWENALPIIDRGIHWDNIKVLARQNEFNDITAIEKLRGECAGHS